MTTTRSKEEFLLVFAFFTQTARECGVTVSDLKKMFSSKKYPEIYQKLGGVNEPLLSSEGDRVQ